MADAFFNKLHTLTGHAQDKPYTEAEIMEARRSPNPQVRALAQLAFKSRGEIARRKAAASK